TASLLYLLPKLSSKRFARKYFPVGSKLSEARNGTTGTSTVITATWPFCRTPIFSTAWFSILSSAAAVKAEANFVSKTTLFQVTVSKNGKHFKVVIGEHCGLNLVGEDMAAPRRGFSNCRVPASPYLPDLKDSPEGPIIGTAG